MSFTRYVALGDSFTEGVGDDDPTRPNGVRGWADRVAEVLAGRAAAAGEEFGYANLAIRGRKLAQIVAEQVDPAIALAPDLVTVYAGANDILRPSVDLDALAATYDEAIGRLAATGATIGIFTAFDPGPTRSSGRCVGGMRSTASGSARSPTPTAAPSSTCGGCAAGRRRRCGPRTGCISMRSGTT